MAKESRVGFTPFTTPPTVMRVLAGLASMRLFGRHGFSTADSNRLWLAAVMGRRAWAKAYLADFGRELTYTTRRRILACPPPAVTWDRPAVACKYRTCPFCHARNVMRVFSLLRDGLADQDVVLATYRPRLVNLTAAATQSLENFVEPIHDVIVPWVQEVRKHLVRRWQYQSLTGVTFLEMGGRLPTEEYRGSLVTWQPRLKTITMVPRWMKPKARVKIVKGCEDYRILSQIAVKRFAFELGFYLTYPRSIWKWAPTAHAALSTAMRNIRTNSVTGIRQSGLINNEELGYAEPQDLAGSVCAGDFDGWDDDGSDHGGVFGRRAGRRDVGAVPSDAAGAVGADD